MTFREPLIVCEGVSKRFGARWILRDVDLVVRAGEVLGVIGPGGHGKSVLLKLLAGLLRPERGVVRVEGRDLAALSAFELARIRNEFGYLFQNYALFDFMTVADNVAFPLRQQGDLGEEAVAERVRARLEEVDLGHTLALRPNELSGGMKKRVGLARATVTNPRIVLYDDPSAGLDPVTSSKIFLLVEQMHRHTPGCASVVVSHDIDRMRMICDRYVMLHEGRVVFDGPEEAMEDADPVVREFFRGAVMGHVGGRP
ncbi:MAG: ABC transporter ATP-binding protein [Myxococcota bacterium]